MAGMFLLGRKAMISCVIILTAIWSIFGGVMFAGAAQPCTSGSLIKGSQLAVYYCGADGKRYVFPNEKTYFTWYSNFSSVVKITDPELASVPIGGIVTYRPGTKMIKLESSPKIYVIAHGGVLRWITSASIASCIFGADWNTMVEDLSDAFFTNYSVGSDVNICAQYDRASELNLSQTINQDKGLSAVSSPIVTPFPVQASPTETNDLSLRVISTSPANSETNIPVDQNLTATFSEDMNPATVNNLAFMLADGGVASGVVTYDSATRTATFNPSGNLSINTTYTAHITLDAQAISGNTLPREFRWIFTTGM